MAAQTVQNQIAHNHSTDDHSTDAHEVNEHSTDVTAQNGDSPAGSHKQNGERKTAGWDQNPQLLQWRANVLLDEMMLGAVDITASEFTHAAPAPSRPTRTSTAVDQPTRPIERDDRRDERMNNRSMPSTASHENRSGEDPRAEADEAQRVERDAPRAYTDNRRDTAQPEAHADDGQLASDDAPDIRLPPARDPEDEWARPAWHFADPASGSQLPPAPNPTPATRAAILQEYTRAQTKPTAVTAPRSRAGGSGTASATRPAQPPVPKDNVAKGGAEQWVLAAEQRYQKIAVHALPEHEANGSTGAASLSVAGWGDPTDALFEDFPATSSQARSRSDQGLLQSVRRSNLLPRMTTADPRALQQEMVMLQSEIEQALPVGHESRERALHLLQKAYSLLQSDASRSAEVDYYLQQVRTIGQRVQESLHWSNLYHSRLRLYLLAWMVLSLIVISSRYFYHTALVATIMRLSSNGGASESLFAHNVLTGFAAFFAGSLGGAIGAFINMHRYAHVQQGFFDRKYSLRGLILPLIGAIVSLVLCLGFGLIYYLFRIDPAQNLLLGALPALFAFAFGIAQEFIYGTRS